MSVLNQMCECDFFVLQNSHTDADEAFKILSSAFETLGTPVSRMSLLLGPLLVECV